MFFNPLSSSSEDSPEEEDISRPRDDASFLLGVESREEDFDDFSTLSTTMLRFCFSVEKCSTDEVTGSLVEILSGTHVARTFELIDGEIVFRFELLSSDVDTNVDTDVETTLIVVESATFPSGLSSGMNEARDCVDMERKGFFFF